MGKRKQEFVWLDGKIVPEKKAVIPIKCQAIQYGLACFEGIRFYNTRKGIAIFRLEDHLKRWKYSMDTLRMKPRFSVEELRDGIIATIEINTGWNNFKEGYIRPWVGYTEKKLGLSVNPEKITFALYAVDWPNYFSKPLNLMTSPFIRPHPESIDMKAKICGCYVNSFLAKSYAENYQFDDALILDYDGTPAEATVANLFVCWTNSRGKKMIITSNSKSILPGITRNTVITVLKDGGYTIIYHGLISPELIYDHEKQAKKVQEIFVCGTAAEITPVVSIDKRKISDGQPGPLTKMLQKVYTEVVRGEIPKYEHWLTYIN